jgi:hypothetical protein
MPGVVAVEGLRKEKWAFGRERRAGRYQATRRKRCVDIVEGRQRRSITSAARLLERFERETAFAPAIQAAGERPGMSDSQITELQRHTGAGGFVGSSAVEHPLPVLRNLAVPPFDLLGQYVERTGKPDSLRVPLEFVAQVDKSHGCASIHLALYLLG